MRRTYSGHLRRGTAAKFFRSSRIPFMSDYLKTDLKLMFDAQSEADLAVHQDLQLVSGRDNLAQALLVRLLTRQGELATLGHRRYGSRAHELIGQSLDEANRQLLRRLVRLTLKQDPRVAEVVEVRVSTSDVPGVLRVHASVKPITDDEPLELEVNLDVR
jgi:phage baseplate assembly protein W